MPQLYLKLGQTVFELNFVSEYKVEREVLPFVMSESEVMPDYQYDFVEIEDIVTDENLNPECWGQWMITQGENRQEVRYRQTDDTGITYMKYEELSKTHFRISYIPSIRVHLGGNRFTLSMMALEKRMLEQQGMILHASFIVCNGQAVLFSAPSQTGKSTQADLWEKYRNAQIINGDRVLIIKKEEQYYACGWPVCGSSQISFNACVPIAAIVLLGQGTDNMILPATPATMIRRLIPEVTINRWNQEAYMKSLDLIEDMVQKIRMIDYTCTMSQEAVEFLYAAIMEEGDEVIDA